MRAREDLQRPRNAHGDAELGGAQRARGALRGDTEALAVQADHSRLIGLARHANQHLCVDNKLAQPSANWRTGGCFQRLITPPAARSFRPASANQPVGPRWPATSALVSTWTRTLESISSITKDSFSMRSS